MKKKFDQDAIIQKCIEAFKLNKKPTHIPKEFLGAFKIGHRQIVREMIDDDQAFDLLKKWLINKDEKAKEALAWLTKFNNEAYAGVLKKNDPNALHNTDKLYKAVNDSRNAMRRDVMTARRNTVISTDSTGHENSDTENATNEHVKEKFANQNRNILNHEDVVIALLDNNEDQDE